MQHGCRWRGENIVGWYASEKLDGCRGYWNGEWMFSRSGRVIPIPETWRAKLPSMHFDGEIWAGRGKWDVTVAAVLRRQWVPDVVFLSLTHREWMLRGRNGSRRRRRSCATNSRP